MHTATFKTFVNTGDETPKELSVEYIPESDLLVFSVNGHEVFNVSYTNNFEPIVGGITTIRGIQSKLSQED